MSAVDVIIIGWLAFIGYRVVKAASDQGKLGWRDALYLVGGILAIYAIARIG